MITSSVATSHNRAHVIDKEGNVSQTTYWYTHRGIGYRVTVRNMKQGFMPDRKIMAWWYIYLPMHAWIQWTEEVTVNEIRTAFDKAIELPGGLFSAIDHIRICTERHLDPPHEESWQKDLVYIEAGNDMQHIWNETDPTLEELQSLAKQAIDNLIDHNIIKPARGH